MDMSFSRPRHFTLNVVHWELHSAARPNAVCKPSTAEWGASRKWNTKRVVTRNTTTNSRRLESSEYVISGMWVNMSYRIIQRKLFGTTKKTTKIRRKSYEIHRSKEYEKVIWGKFCLTLWNLYHFLSLKTRESKDLPICRNELKLISQNLKLYGQFNCNWADYRQVVCNYKGGVDPWFRYF